MLKTLLAEWIKQHGDGTQTHFARLVGCSGPTISLILKGKKRPGRHLARRISRVTGLSLEAVLFGDTE